MFEKRIAAEAFDMCQNSTKPNFYGALLKATESGLIDDVCILESQSSVGVLLTISFLFLEKRTINDCLEENCQLSPSHSVFMSNKGK